MGLAADDLARLPKVLQEKAALTAWLRKRATVSLGGLSAGLKMGHYSGVSQAVSGIVRKPSQRLEKLKKKLIQLDCCD